MAQLDAARARIPSMANTRLFRRTDMSDDPNLPCYLKEIGTGPDVAQPFEQSAPQRGWKLRISVLNVSA
jgi:hypothetical protein